MSLQDQTTPLTLTTASVCRMLGISAPTFRNKRRMLEERHNFPRKLPGVDRYSYPAVERWIATNGESHQPETSPELDQIRDELEAEFGQGRAA